jgi:hypothetical protein
MLRLADIAFALHSVLHLTRRKIQLIEGNAKCHHLKKKLTFNGIYGRYLSF